MNEVGSFKIDHDVLEPGIYTSRVDFGDIVTYDIRYYLPNAGQYLSPASAHTIEHLFAVWIRSSEIGDNVIYFGPMGCLTGFYLILKGVEHSVAVDAILRGMQAVAEWEGEIPAAKRKNCGNYLMHDLVATKLEAKRFCEKAKGWTADMLDYPGMIEE